MDLLITLMNLEERLWKLKMSKTKKVYVSTEEIQEKMRNNEPIPTSIFNTTETDYIVTPRTICRFKSKKRSKQKL